MGNMETFRNYRSRNLSPTDTGSNLKDLFTADKEVVTYNSEDELFEKLNYLLNNDSVRKEIGPSWSEKNFEGPYTQGQMYTDL